MYKIIVQAANARPGAPLAPVLGQIQIKVQDFITDFNRQSSDYAEGLPLQCRIEKLPQPTRFTLQVLPPSWGTLLWGVSVRNRLQPAELYDCFIYRYGRPPTPFEVRLVLGTVKACRLRIV